MLHPKRVLDPYEENEVKGTRMPNYAIAADDKLPSHPIENDYPSGLNTSPSVNHYPKQQQQPPQPISQPIMNGPPRVVDKIIPNRRPQAPPVRIDTCIVGDDSTCEMEKHEVCQTHLGVSSCNCKPGYGRSNHRRACKSML